jgi:nitrilase
MSEKDHLTVAVAQIAPVWLQREKTLAKILDYVHEAGGKACDLIVFGEALLPGYPFWVELTDGARFNSKIQKEIHAHYMGQAIQVEAGHLDPLCEAAKKYGMAIMTGSIERAPDRGGHSLYCSLIYITKKGVIANVHRKLMPTYEERLTWASGDGHGLRTFPIGPFTIGGLNCWENWMPLPRAALYAMGEDLHVAIWPGNLRNTDILTRFLAREGRSYVISVSGLMRREDFPEGTPHLDRILENASPILADGGSSIANPDGTWLLEPMTNGEFLKITTLNHARVREERQNFDPSGHYARPDVTQLTVNRERQEVLKINEGEKG